MSKPIILKEEVKMEFLGRFKKFLDDVRLTDGKISYVIDDKLFKYEKNQHVAEVVFSAVAYSKMVMLLSGFSTEVAWHGVCRRDEEADNIFYVDDILVYPQTVTGSTVDMDQEGYGMWLFENDEDERFDRIRMQGHSHVNFGVTPSGTDRDHQDEILAEMPRDTFYIFMIMNKKFDRHFEIYDLANNILYENEDVDLYIGDENVNLDLFMADAKEMVKTKTYNYTGNNYNRSTPAVSNTPATKKDDEGAAGSKPKTKAKKNSRSNEDCGYENSYEWYNRREGETQSEYWRRIYGEYDGYGC